MQHFMCQQHQQQCVAPQQLWVLVPAGSVDGPQAVLYAAPSGVVNSTVMQADAPLLSGSAYSSSSSSDHSSLVHIPQAPGVYVLAPPQPLGPGSVLDPPGILQPPAGALNGMVQAPQALGVLAWSHPQGTGPMLDPPAVLQQPAVVVDTTSMQADAPRPGDSTCSSSSTDPTACASTPQVSKFAHEDPLGVSQCARGCACPARWTTTHMFLACSKRMLHMQPLIGCEYKPYLSPPSQENGRGLAFCSVVCAMGLT